MENLPPQKNLHKNNYSSFICSRQNLKASNMSTGKWIDKLWSIQTMEYYSSLRRNELSSHENPWRNLNCILQSKRSHPKKSTYMCDSTYMIFWKKQNYEDSKKVRGCQWLGGRKGWIFLTKGAIFHSCFSCLFQNWITGKVVVAVMLVLITRALLLNNRNQHTLWVHFTTGLREVILGQKEGSVSCTEHISRVWPVANPDNTSSTGQEQFQGGEEIRSLDTVML